MLANLYRSAIDLDAYWVSEKYDGVRGYWDGARLLTRGGTEIQAPGLVHRRLAIPRVGRRTLGRARPL
jgi:DNA ligase-1